MTGQIFERGYTLAVYWSSDSFGFSSYPRVCAPLQQSSYNPCRSKLFVVACIPALNEERTIEYVVRGALKYVDLVVVVDDLSVDNTAVYAREAGARVISLDRRRRLGGVIRAGLEYLKKLDPDVVIMLDSDGQHDPNDIPRLVRPVLEGRCDWVIGSRFLDRRSKTRFRGKNIGRRFFSRVVSLLAGKRITDAMSGFRAFNRKCLDHLHLKFDYGYAPEMDIILGLEGHRLAEISIPDIPRKYGLTKVVKNKLIYVLKQMGIVLFTFLKTRFLIKKDTECEMRREHPFCK